MFSSNIINCEFSRWYSKFAHLTVESDIIKLSQQFIDYLLADGIQLPKSCVFNESADDWSDDEINGEIKDENDDSDDDEKQNNSCPEFPELEEKILASISRFGYVFPKLNWSSPQDASWITPCGTKCRELADVFLLLKSSDFIVHDLTEPFEHCIDKDTFDSHIEYELILRRWVDINPSNEFRCFVVNNRLIGISQRDLTSYYSYIRLQKHDIVADIVKFFNLNIKNKFLDSNFVFDVCRSAKDRIILIDFNPFGQLTSAKLFDWDELEELSEENQEVQFRYIDDKTGILPQNYAMFAMPIEAIQANARVTSDIFNYINDIER